MADRIVFLDGGRVVEEATLDELFANVKHRRTKEFLNQILIQRVFEPVYRRREITELKEQ